MREDKVDLSILTKRFRKLVEALEVQAFIGPYVETKDALAMGYAFAEALWRLKGQQHRIKELDKTLQHQLKISSRNIKDCLDLEDKVKELEHAIDILEEGHLLRGGRDAP